MSIIDPVIADIVAAAKTEGLPALAKRTGIPYTTLRDWERSGWRVAAVRTFERLAKATHGSAEANPAPSSQSEAA